MLALQETFWQLVRNKGRTVILVLASAMLAGCMAFYLSNIRANEEAIDRLAETMFQTDETVCLINREFAERNGIEVGDEVSLPIYTLTYDLYQAVIYTPLGEQTLKVVGTSHSFENPKEFMAPEKWMRKVMESQWIDVMYNEQGATLKDPRQLNAFKDSTRDLQLLEPNPETMDESTGGIIIVEDEQYVTSAETLGKTVVLFGRFQAPFFGLVIGMIVLAIFLIMRGSHRVIAISASLGRSKFLCALASFLAAFLAEPAGCALVLPAMVLLAGLSLTGGLMICAALLLLMTGARA